MKNIIRTILCLATSFFMMVACKDEPQESHWFQSGYDNDNILQLDPNSTDLKDVSTRIVVKSNAYWHIVSDAPEWCTVYPETGHNEGRIYVTAQKLDNPYSRTCTLSVYDENENLLSVIPVLQNGVEKILSVPTSLSVSSDGDDNIVIDVESNVNWAAKLVSEADASWIELGEPDLLNNRLPVKVKANTGEARNSKIIFFMVEDPEYFSNVETSVSQVEYATPATAALKSLSEVFTGEDGIINENIKIEAVVVNNKESMNYELDDNQLLLQDNSGKCAKVVLANSALNTFKCGEKVTLWLMGATKDLTDGMISGIGTANIIASAMTTDNVAVVIDDLSQLSSIKNNTLVQLSNVNFVVPLGTLYNLTKDGFKCDVLVRDKFGNTFTIRTNDTYTDRHSVNITNGSFNVTGLVDCSDTEMQVLRVRSASDIEKLSNIVYSPINEWYGGKDMITTTNWKVATGDASASATFGVAISSSDKKSAFALKDCSQAYSTDNTYWGPSLKSWNGDAQCYKFTVSTQSATGDIYLSIWSLSYSSSIRDMKVEWSESEDATVWNDCLVTLVQHNSALGISNEYPLGIYSVKAVGAQGHPKVCFKLSKASSKRADNTTNAISSSGPNYICYFGVYESLK